MIGVLLKALRRIDKFPSVRKSFMTYLAWEIGFELVGLAIDGIKARAAVKLFPVALYNDEAESLMFMEWATKNRAIKRKTDDEIVGMYVDWRERVERGSAEHARLILLSAEVILEAA